MVEKEINQNGRSASASLIMANNIRVAILAFAGGTLLGLLTLFILAQNECMVGTSWRGRPRRWSFPTMSGALSPPTGRSS